MGFTVHRPADAEVSPCCHRPSGGDVACGVHVGVARTGVAGDAPENRLALAVFRRDMPAHGASLRRVRSWDAFESPRSFVLEPGDQQSPALTADFTIESPFLGNVDPRAFTRAARRASHRRNIQVLDTDGVEAARQIGGGLLHPVTSAIGFPRAYPGNGQPGSRPPVRSAVGPGELLLQSTQPLGFTTAKPRGVQQLPGGQRRRHGYAAIHTHHAAVAGCGDRLGDVGKSDVPSTRSIQCDAIGLHRIRGVASPAKPHPTDLGDPYLPVAPAEPRELVQFDADLPKSFVAAGLAPRRPAVGAAKKIAHRLGEVAQGLLLHRLRPRGQPPVFSAGCRQLRTLLVVIRCVAARLPVPLLLDSQIPHKPGMATMLDQYRRLPRCGKQPKSGHIGNLDTTTDNTSKGGRGVPPG